MLDRLLDTHSFSYVTRIGDVTRIPGVALDTVGTGLLTPELGFDRLESPISPGKNPFRHQISRKTVP